MASRVDPADYDEDEPYVLEHVRLGPAEISDLAGVALAAAACEFIGCDLSAVSFHGVKNSRFSACKLRGTRFTKHLTSVRFENCQLNEARFRLMQLKDVHFEDSQLTNCDFYGAELAVIDFDRTSFEGLGFDACTLTDVDLTAATQLLIGDPRTLKGAALCETQVPAIAARLAQLSGIDVRDC